MKLTGDRCQCAACGLYFNSTAAFDKHRDGPMIQRRCLSDVEMQAKGMAVNARGFWVSALNPQYADMARRRIAGDAPLFAEVA